MRNITNVGWAIGTFCNASCKQCYSRNYRCSQEILTYDEIDIILQKLSDFGIRTINLGGNEPIFTDGKDIEKTKLPYLLKKARQYGFTVGITTNGTTANYLHDNTDAFDLVDDWDISLDSVIANEHNGNRGAEFYENAVRAIQKIRNNRKSISAIYCLMNWNSTTDHAERLSEFCKEHGMDLRTNTLKPIVKEHFALLPTSKDIKTFFSVISKYFDLISSSDVCVSESLPIAKLKKCLCGSHSFSIGAKRADGKVPISPCVYMQDFASGDILRESIASILSNAPIFDKLQDRYERGAIECRKMNCKYIDFCGGGCAAYAYLTTGDVMNADKRCLICAGESFDRLIPMCESTDSKKVHENYLCTYIGKLKK